MVRCSIREYLQPFVNEIGTQLGTDDPTEIITFVLNDYKRQLKQRTVQTNLSSQSTETADEELLALLDS
ncbi:hypothetical protein [Leptolyngbya sp. NIES-2104]|uniref:hypothetical protein n=1 Tax=Leptolyngbya sp. NIES-2104 TaxID=1552121 RepID=UPI0006EC8555|nr:hypothetical protein [Leptolyngbya sp. NIES-2104]GAP99096.1 hypothetical protein NIES2104_56530 [Leptolyngbya sp. NIES-2104]